MKFTLKSILISLALAASAQAADVNVTLSKVHLCCKSCVNGAEKAVGKVEGVTATVDREGGNISLKGSDAASVQKATDALVAAGYFGKSSDSNIKVKAKTKAKGEKVQTLHVSGVHLCCGKCVSTVDEALKAVAGVKSHTAEKNAKSFEVKGDFNDKDVFSALHKAGLAGTVGN